jgi:hypothetical protein
VTAWTKLVLGMVVATVVGIIAMTVLVASKVREETVVEHPYEEGLKHTERRPPACDLGQGPCTAPLEGGGEVTLEIGPRPIATMRELAVRATVRETPHAGAISVAFSMPGMEMGTNRIVLDLAAGPPRPAPLSQPSPPEGERGGGEQDRRYAISQPSPPEGERGGGEGDRRYVGKAVLVRCASGKRDWIATVSVTSVGEPVRVARFRLTAAE